MINRRGLLQNGLTQTVFMALAVGAGSAHGEFAAEFDLSSLNGANGAVLSGAAVEDNAGQSVSSAGDLNGDGISDLVIGAPCATTGQICAGAAYVVYGKQQGLPNPLNLSAITDASGIVVRGENVFDFVGNSVGVAGDLNGDDFEDLIIGASESSLNASYAGAALVVFGTDQGLPGTLNMSELDGSNGFIVLGNHPNSSTGSSVSGAGDVNGDGFDDVVVGAPFTLNGSAYVAFGGSQFDGSLSVANLDGGNGFVINGINEGDELGRSVAGAGDINGDGSDDLIIGAALAGSEGAYAGAAYIIFGQPQGQLWSPTFDPSGLDGNNGFVIVGQVQFDNLGWSVAAAGDINGDGVGDIIVGAPLADPNGSESGATYVVFGSDQGFASAVEVAGLNGTNGFAIHGAAAGDRSGESVSAAGDINGDGVDDLIIGAPGADPHGDASGASYVVFGKPQGQAWQGTLALATLNGTNGFRINGVSSGDQSGTSVSVAGDINVDGRVDFLVGAPFRDSNGAGSGAGYVVYDASPVKSDTIFADGFER